jgi:23S rRNA (cytidine1920-2'-O)/16S rRNA (cytidine1409-2'-O)-methyltransferase
LQIDTKKTAMRLDVYLVNNHFFTSREQAKFNISRGNVVVNGKPATKPSLPITESDRVTLLAENAIPYASRGGLKLEKALSSFSIDCSNINALDVGASTGGFTDCLLKNGARHVCAVDVGTNQLVTSLRNDHRVTSIENMHIKDLNPSQIDPNLFNLIVADLSFISLTNVLEYLPKFLDGNGQLVALIKPQFEVGPSHIGKGGLVKSPNTHIQAIKNIATESQRVNLNLSMLTYAPVIDLSKNIEYLGLFSQKREPLPNIDNIVRDAFATRAKSKSS